MASRALTDLDIKHLKPRDQQYEIFDPSISGLAIRVSPGGAKAFVLLYRVGRRPRRYTIGRYPVLSLKNARQRANDALKIVALGKDPQTRKLTERARYQSTLFPTVAAAFVEKYAKPNTTWNETDRILRREFSSRWKNMRLQDISKHHVADVLDELVANSGPSAANHAFAAVRRLFNWCVERSDLSVSPCAGLKQPAQTFSRERVLTKDEVVTIWNAAEAMGYPFGSMIKVLLLTGQRRSEVSTLRWPQLDLEGGLWTQPSPSNKSKRIHLVPLSGSAIEVLRQIPRGNDDQFVFPARGRTNRAVSGFSKWKRRLDKLSGTTDWTIHDIRRTVNTGLAALKVPPHVADHILNHKGSVRSSVAAIYDRHDYLDEKRDALERWAAYMMQLAKDDR